ncbi:DeoR/GlpR family DNA-binding transcription regulator [Alicyclobacillus fastidiosus]|uniref:DeoR/GlpR family DNA-binding transcription regulator n=1 Tax=Alicyclobacillus fastidiosus TaxID=392011 RepID=A0ABY6ZCG2_9BACL|nr:DeoR/GlpR family DNA-binding transcription regulator [Alicyclobacillus fastidiosus]WAH40575.1 DeoR/GlpR family DNA-binding transcription regulator [Alicyclobacillus fastidiosus]GMA62010.1 putative HTH-type transcriptional regulator YulB [Alicyclobacillus fastidiosus]
MLPAERHRAIVDLVNTRGSIRVKELSQLFDVTEETVRRDLDNLSNEGRIRRSHGGAVRVSWDTEEVPYRERENVNVSEKQAIARKAIQYIDAGDRIALDASTTAWHVAVQLPDIPLTVLTNSLKVALELSDRPKIEVVSTGGILRANSLSNVGPMAEEALSRFYVNKAFLSCKCCHLDYGISETDTLQALVKQKMIEISDKVFLLADLSKLGVRDFAQVATIKDLDVLITNGPIPYDMMQEFNRVGVEVVQALEGPLPTLSGPSIAR